MAFGRLTDGVRYQLHNRADIAKRGFSEVGVF